MHLLSGMAISYSQQGSRGEIDPVSDGYCFCLSRNGIENKIIMNQPVSVARRG